MNIWALSWPRVEARRDLGLILDPSGNSSGLRRDVEVWQYVERAGKKTAKDICSPCPPQMDHALLTLFDKTNVVRLVPSENRPRTGFWEDRHPRMMSAKEAPKPHASEGNRDNQIII